MLHTLYGSSVSGNCWKPAFMLRQRGLPFRWIEIDIFEKQTRTPEFLAKNPNGRVPLLELPDGRLLAESNAMLLHLGEGTPWIPDDAYDRAKMYEWMCFEQYSHEPYIASVRFWTFLQARGEDCRAKIAERTPGSYAALAVMEHQLQRTPFFVGRGAEPRRHRALRVQPCRARGRVRARPVSRGASVARTVRRTTRVRRDAVPRLSARRRSLRVGSL